MLNRFARPRLTAALAASAALLAAPGLVPAVKAGDVVHLSPERVLAQADAIFQGTVVAQNYGWTDARQVFATTEYTIRIDRVLLDRGGLLAAQTVQGHFTLSIMGGVQNGVRYNVSGMPRLAVGESAFVFLSAENIRNRAMSPIVGDSEGLFPVRAHQGEWKVFTPGGCLGPSRPIDFRFFAKFRDAGASYTPDEFALEIARALPLAEGEPALRNPPEPGAGPAMAHPRTFGPLAHASQDVFPGALPVQGLNTIPADPAPAPITKPQPSERFLVDTATEAFDPPGRLEWGQDSDEPSYPIVFNVPPGTWWRNAFIGEQARWNRYAAGVFRFFSESNNQIGWPNGRFETAFLTNQQMIDLYGRGWGGNTLGRCISREGIFTDRIVEADVCFNAAQTFTDSLITTYTNSTNSFQATAVHELGHAFGRVHAWESNPAFIYPSNMNYYQSGFYDAESARVFADDAESIRVAYNGAGIMDFGLTLWRNSGALAPFGNPPISVNGVTGLSMPASVLQGNFFSVSNIWLENLGTVTRGTTIDWYLDPTPYDFNLNDARYCSSTTIGTLDRYNGVVVTTNIPAPQNIAPGNYYLCGVIADADAILDNDFAWSQSTIRVDFNPAFSPPANDSRTTPRAIGLGTHFGSTQFATQDGTANCGSSNTTPDVWFSITAPYSGRLDVDTCGSSYDTVVSIQRRQFNPITFGFTYAEIACNDDAGFGACAGSRQSFANAQVSQGDLIRIRLSGFNGAKGNYVLGVNLIPANDFCTNAAPVGNGTFTATMAGSTNSNAGTCGLTQSTPDIWFRYTFPPNCYTVNINTNGSNFDTVLEAWPSCPLSFSIPFGCNDDCGPVGPSCLTVTRGAASDILIRVSQYGGTPRAGDLVVLNISSAGPSNDTCAAATPITDGEFAFDSSCASTDGLAMPLSCGGGTCVNDFWFTYTAPISGRLELSVDSTTVSPAIAVYPGFACPGNPEAAIACAYNPGIPYPAPQASLDVTAGETFYLRFGGATFPGQLFHPSGTGTIAIRTVELPPANDDRAAPQPILAGQVFAGALALATPDGASSADRVPGGPDLWFTFTAPANGRFLARTCGTLLASGLDTVLSLHDEAFTELAASDNNAIDPCSEGLSDPEDAALGYDVAAGSAYLLRVAATDPGLVGTGAFTLTIEFAIPADACASPAALPDGTSLFSTFGATPDGPATDCFDGTEPDIWFAYTSSCSGVARISTCGIPYDTKIAVYAVSCPDADSAVIACNAGNGSDCEGGAASLDFPCAEGAIYYVRVAGDVPTASGITVTCFPVGHPADACGNGNPLTDGDVPVTTFAATPDGVAGGCFSGDERDIWYTYTASCTGTVSVSLCTDPGASKLAVYAQNTCPVDEPIACNEGDGPACPGSAASLVFQAQAGAEYQIRIAIADDNAHLLSIACTPDANPCPADFNQDGNVDPDDLSDYIGCYFTPGGGCDRADFNNDGNADPDDLSDFIGTYFGPPC